MTAALRAEIRDAVAILVAAEVMDYNGHASRRHPDGGFLINSAGSDRAAMTEAQIVRVLPDGSAEGSDRAPNEAVLHAAVYAARPDVAAVLHGHPKWSTLFTLTGQRIPLVMPQGALVADLPLYDQSHSISTPERGAAMAQSMAKARGVLLRAHGSVFAAPDLIEAAALAIYAEQNAERAFRAAQIGTAAVLGPDEAAEYRQTLNTPGLFRKCWDFHLSKGGTRDVR